MNDTQRAIRHLQRAGLWPINECRYLGHSLVGVALAYMMYCHSRPQGGLGRFPKIDRARAEHAAENIAITQAITYATNEQFNDLLDRNKAPWSLDTWIDTEQ